MHYCTVIYSAVTQLTRTFYLVIWRWAEQSQRHRLKVLHDCRKMELIAVSRLFRWHNPTWIDAYAVGCIS